MLYKSAIVMVKIMSNSKKKERSFWSSKSSFVFHASFRYSRKIRFQSFHNHSPLLAVLLFEASFKMKEVIKGRVFVTRVKNWWSDWEEVINGSKQNSNGSHTLIRWLRLEYLKRSQEFLLRTNSKILNISETKTTGR